MKLVIAEPIGAAGIALLRAQPGWEVVLTDPAGCHEHLADCDAIFLRSGLRLTAELLARAPRLQVIGRAGSGLDNIDHEAAHRAGIAVYNVPGGNAVAVAEHTFALMLALARHIPAASRSLRAGLWEKARFAGTELRGKTLGIVGLGRIGREVARRATAFEMHVAASDPYVDPRTAAACGATLTSLDRLLATSDYVSLHTALTGETRGLIGRAAFACLKPGARLINTARGAVVDRPALEEAIASGKLAGAGLDVFDPEPPEPGSPLLEWEGLVATPHLGGSTAEAQEAIGLRIAETVIAHLKEHSRA